MTEITFKSTYKSVLKEIDNCLLKVSEKEVNDFIIEIFNAEKIFLIGAGRMGMMLGAFCMRLNHIGLSSHVVGTINCPPISSKDLLIVASSSGKTVSNLVIVKEAVKYKARIFTITAAPSSPIAGLSTSILYMQGPSSLYNHKFNSIFSKQPMKALFEQSLLILLDSVLLMMIKKTGKTMEEIAAKHANLE